MRRTNGCRRTRGRCKKSGRTEARRDGSAAVIYGDERRHHMRLAVHEDPIRATDKSGEKRFPSQRS